MEENKFKRMLKYLGKTINYVQKKTLYPYTIIFFDIVWCFLRYGTTYNDYRIFEFYNIGGDLRKTYMSRRKYNKYKKKLVDESITNVIEDKNLFLLRFKDYMKTDIFDTKKMNYKEFEIFSNENRKLLARSSSSSFVKSFKRFDLSNFRSPAFMNGAIQDNHLSLVQKDFIQHKALDDIAPLVIVNTHSVYNNGCDIVTSTIKYKDGNEIINGYVDTKTGIIKGKFKDKDGQDYGEKFDGFQIPFYDRILSITNDLCHELEEIKEVEWSFLVGSRGVYLVDANVWSDYVFSQTPEFLKDKIGLLPYYKEL